MNTNQKGVTMAKRKKQSKVQKRAKRRSSAKRGKARKAAKAMKRTVASAKPKRAQVKEVVQKEVAPAVEAVAAEVIERPVAVTEVEETRKAS
jgi:flagellar biosynthesis/type III secretory pathway protein FliH